MAAGSSSPNTPPPRSTPRRTTPTTGEVPWDRLSPEDTWTLQNIAWRVYEGHSYDEIAARLTLLLDQPVEADQVRAQMDSFRATLRSFATDETED